MKIISIFSVLFLFQVHSHAKSWFVSQAEVRSILNSTPQKLGEFSMGQILRVPEIQNLEEGQARVIRIVSRYGPSGYTPILHDRNCQLTEGYLEILGFDTKENKSLMHYYSKEQNF